MNKKLYEYKINVRLLSGEYWYTLEVRRIGFLWRGRWKEVTPLMQPDYKSAMDLFKSYE